MPRQIKSAAFPVFLVILALLTLQALAALSVGWTLNRESLVTVTLIMVIVAFATLVEVPLQGDGMSLGYAASLLAVLALGQPDDLFTSISVIGVGGLLGGVIRALWRDWQVRRRLGWRTLGWAVTASAQLVIALAVGASVYRAQGGILPLVALRLSFIPALISLISVSMIVYMVLYVLILLWRGLSVRRIFADNQWTILLALFAPLPLMLVAALVIRVSLVGFVILSGGLLGLAVLSTELGRQRLRYRRQVRELSSLSAVGRAVRANLDMDALLQTIHLQVATLLEIDTFTLALYDPDRRMVYFPLAFREGQRRTLAPYTLGKGLIDQVIASQAGLLIESDVAREAAARGLTPPDGGATSWLGVPLLASERAMGALAIASNDPARRFTADDRRLLTTIAAQGAISIENAQLYHQTQERSRQLGLLNDLTTRLSGTLDTQRVLDLVVASTTEIAHAQGVAVFLGLDDAQNTLAMVRSVGVNTAFRDDPPLPLLYSSLLSDKEKLQANPLIVPDLRTDARAAALREILIAQGFNAWIELPLRNGADSLGALVAYYRQPQRFASEEVEVLRAFANQAALSISNARLYRRTDEALEQRIAQISALASINQELASTLDLQHLFARVLDYALDGTSSVGGALLLRPDSGSTAPRIVAQRGQDIRKTIEMLSRPTTARALQTNTFVVERSALPELSVPIARDNDVMGVITLYSVEKDSYKPDDILFVRQLATQAVIAVDNARLFNRTEESRDRLQVILDSMHEAVLLIDADGTVLLANPQVNFMFDLPTALITGQTLEALLGEADLNLASALGFTPEALLDLVAQMQEGRWAGGHTRQSYRIERPLVRFIDRTIVSTHASGGQVIGLLMVFSDATEERELVQAREDLTRMIVHDLRSPLTAISTGMRLLTEMAPADPSLARMLTRTTDGSQRALRKLLNLVNSLLDIAKMESGSMTLIRADHMLAPIAQGVRIELMPLAEELEIMVTVVIPDDLPDLFIDAPKIERVLLNLVDNALKFTPYAGLVKIVAQISTERPEFARIEVCDTGSGIPDSYKMRIFDRFEQVDGSQGRRRGTGLGLTFCKLTVEAHGGQIWIEDNPGGGSIFVFLLPLSKPRAEETKQHVAHVDSAAH